MNFYQHFKTKPSFLEAMRTFDGKFSQKISKNEQLELLIETLKYISFLQEEVIKRYQSKNLFSPLKNLTVIYIIVILFVD